MDALAHHRRGRSGSLAGGMVYEGMRSVAGRSWARWCLSARGRRHHRSRARFYAFATSCALSTMGLLTFGVISFHLVDASLVSTAVVPLIYAAAMGAEQSQPW